MSLFGGFLVPGLGFWLGWDLGGDRFRHQNLTHPRTYPPTTPKNIKNHNFSHILVSFGSFLVGPIADQMLKTLALGKNIHVLHA